MSRPRRSRCRPAVPAKSSSIKGAGQNLRRHSGSPLERMPVTAPRPPSRRWVGARWLARMPPVSLDSIVSMSSAVVAGQWSRGGRAGPARRSRGARRISRVGCRISSLTALIGIQTPRAFLRRPTAMALCRRCARGQAQRRVKRAAHGFSRRAMQPQANNRHGVVFTLRQRVHRDLVPITGGRGLHRHRFAYVWRRRASVAARTEGEAAGRCG